MDKTEKYLKAQLHDKSEELPFDMEELIAGTHRSIRKRASRRKVVYASPVVTAIILLALLFIPREEQGSYLPGGDLLFASWETSWTETPGLDLETEEATEFYDETVDYLIDDNYHDYFDDAQALLDEIDLEALKGYLEEV